MGYIFYAFSIRPRAIPVLWIRLTGTLKSHSYPEVAMALSIYITLSYHWTADILTDLLCPPDNLVLILSIFTNPANPNPSRPFYIPNPLLIPANPLLSYFIRCLYCASGLTLKHPLDLLSPPTVLLIFNKY